MSRLRLPSLKEKYWRPMSAAPSLRKPAPLGRIIERSVQGTQFPCESEEDTTAPPVIIEARTPRTIAEAIANRTAYEKNKQNLADINKTLDLLERDRKPSASKQIQTSPGGTPLQSPRDCESQSSMLDEETEQAKVALKPLMHQLMITVNELQQTMNVEHENDFRLRVALQQQTEFANNLRISLAMEKARNERLLKLIQNVESRSSSEDEHDYMLKPMNGTSGGVAEGGGSGSRRGGSSSSVNISGGVGTTAWHSHTTSDPIETVSPLLMQQRYDELTMSYKKARHQLLRKERKLRQCKCEREKLQARCEYVIEEYCTLQRRLEDVVARFMRWKNMKTQEIYNLKGPIIFAWDCTMVAQGFLYDADRPLNDVTRPAHDRRVITFRKNFRKFMDALKECEWIQVGCDRANCCWPGEPKKRVQPPMDLQRTRELDMLLKEDDKRIEKERKRLEKEKREQDKLLDNKPSAVDKKKKSTSLLSFVRL